MLKDVTESYGAQLTQVKDPEPECRGVIYQRRRRRVQRRKANGGLTYTELSLHQLALWILRLEKWECFNITNRSLNFNNEESREISRLKAYLVRTENVESSTKGSSLFPTMTLTIGRPTIFTLDVPE